MATLVTTSNKSTTNSFLEELARQLSLQNFADSQPPPGIYGFYQSVSNCLEKETGQKTETFINLTPKGWGYVLIFCGQLLVATQFIPNTNSFARKSLEHLAQEGEKIVRNAISVSQHYFT